MHARTATAPNPAALFPAIPRLAEAEFNEVRALALRELGIAFPRSKKELVVGRWARRLHELGLASFGEYLVHIADPDNAGERRTALDLLTTNETYFFRESRHFDWLRENVLASHEGSMFRVWSAACSSGEEPYGLAMMLEDVLGTGRWELLASDISSRMLEAARSGCYRVEAAQRIPPAYLRRFCLRGTGPADGTLLIDRAIRERVQFRTVNLVEPLPPVGQFDAIFLRNVLIYFDGPTRTAVVSRLIATLRPGGLFFVSLCETLNGVTDELEHVAASVYRKPLR